MKRSQGMISTFLHLKGNARACIWTEPLWGIPYNLYAPYVSLYMKELGLTIAEIGYVASISLVVQIISSLLSGILTDKLGRRRCTLIFDTLSWSVPELLWAFSQNFNWFLVAALFNGMWRVTVNSWGLLLIEDEKEENNVVKMFSLTQFMGLLATFFAPLSSIAIHAYGLVPTMRVLYGVTCVSMTTKFIVLNKMTHETEMGKKRMQATKGISVFTILRGCFGVFMKMIREKRMLLTIAIVAVYQVISNVNGSFWGVMVKQKLMIAEGDIWAFVLVRSVVVALCILVFIPRVRYARFKSPMLLSWTVFAAAQGLLIVAGLGAYTIPLLVVSVVLEGFAVSMLSPLVDSLLFINAEPEMRAQILGIIYATTTFLATPFPALAGMLGMLDESMPFLINLAMLGVGMLLTRALWGEKQRLEAIAQAK